MDINTTKQLNIAQTSVIQSKTSAPNPQEDKTFVEELSNAGKEKNETVSASEAKKEKEKQTGNPKAFIDDAARTDKIEENVKKDDKAEAFASNTEFFVENKKEQEQINSAIDGLKDAVSELGKISQKEEKNTDEVKSAELFADIDRKDKFEDINLIDNNMNIQEPAEKKVNIQTETNTNFGNNGQPFAEFINKEQKVDTLKSTEKELAEERAVLSTMEENVAIARKNMLLKENAEKSEKVEKQETSKQLQNNEPVQQKNITIQNDDGIKKVDVKTHLTVDTIVSYDNVVMDKADADFFINLVENGGANITDVQNAQKSAHVSKTLADLLAKAMNENKPVRIDFDNDISVIIKIDRAGKISADFLPSSQVAEAYLKENLPLLRQRFNDNNIDYNELNQRKQKQDTQDNRKKGRKDE